MRIVTVVGARPQFIKAAAVSRALRADPETRESIVHTGQHYDENMSAVFFEELDIPEPDHHLGIGSASHGRQTGEMLTAIESLLVQESPDWALVYGDTNSTLAGALAAAKLHIPVAHVEAGLRSFDRRMPEEVNRLLTDHVSERLLAPTETAVTNLRREGFPDERIELVGDVMYDAALYYSSRSRERSRILGELGLAAGGYVLATIHRAENTDDAGRLGSIVAALVELSRTLPVIVPLHPRTRGALGETNLPDGVQWIDPVGYLDMIQLESHARIIATDSGGVQKEAFFFGVPCVVLRTETEWVELIESGRHLLASPGNQQAVSERLHAALDLDQSPAGKGQLFGGGDAAERIARSLSGRSGGRATP